MIAPLALARTNQILATCEAWQPPAYDPQTTASARFKAAVRRFLDLQAGSIWRDLAVLLPQCNGTAVDVGCGAQPYRRLFDPGVKYVGIDTTDARAHFRYDIPDTTYYAGNTWPLADRFADIVLCTETLEHVSDPVQFLDEMARCLKPGGSVVLTVPFAARWHYIPHDYWRFTPSSLARLLTSAGFEDVKVYARGNSYTVACYKTMALLLPLLLPQCRSPVAACALRLIGLASAPILVGLAAIGQLTLRGRGGDDCLGYTAVATRVNT